MTTITKERLLTIKQWRETYGPGSNVVLPAEEAEELARIALASLEAEPVAWMRDDADGREYNARNEFSGGGGGVPLYATPPVPVVPEEKPMPNPLSMYAVDAVAAIAEVRGWNACRAAMLHGAEPVSQTYKLNELSGNSPVTPDGWISCSERMPDKLIPVMVMYEDGEMWSAMWNGNRWDDGTEYPDPHSVTHWREMPAAPKQEVKS
ncbi:DUF551 domain-containing protein [Escherichia coli]|nr:DUF551 domain-containing protein [Escherichia coli]